MAKKINELNPLERASVSTLLRAEDKAFVFENGALRSMYQNASNKITEKIEAFYGRYAEENKISYEKALEVLGNTERKNYQELLRQYYKEAAGDKAWQAELKALSIKSEIIRLEALNGEIMQELNRLGARIETGIYNLEAGVYEDSYYRTVFNEQQKAGVAESFAKLDKRKINAAISRTYQNMTLSDRVWGNNIDNVINALRSELPQAFITGASVQDLAQTLRDRLDTSYNNAVRLVRTETNRVNSQAVLDSYSETMEGTEEIEFLATLDERTSDICAAMDGQRIRLEDAEIGVNVPPLHPNCRSTTVRVFSDAHFERIAKDADGNYETLQNMTYNEWLEEYVK